MSYRWEDVRKRLNRAKECEAAFGNDIGKFISKGARQATADVDLLLTDADAMLEVVRAANILDLQRLADYIRSVQRPEVEDWEWPQDIEKLNNTLANLPEYLK